MVCRPHRLLGPALDVGQEGGTQQRAQLRIEPRRLVYLDHQRRPGGGQGRVPAGQRHLRPASEPAPRGRHVGGLAEPLEHPAPDLAVPAVGRQGEQIGRDADPQARAQGTGSASTQALPSQRRTTLAGLPTASA